MNTQRLQRIIVGARHQLDRIDNLIIPFRMSIVAQGEDPAHSTYLNMLYIRADIAIVKLRDAQKELDKSQR